MNMQQVIIIMFLTNTKKAKTNQRQTVNKMGKWINFGENICLSSAAYLGRRGSLSWDSQTTSSPATSSSSSWRTQRTAERYNFFCVCPGSHPSWACLNCTDSVWWLYSEPLPNDRAPYPKREPSHPWTKLISTTCVYDLIVHYSQLVLP